MRTVTLAALIGLATASPASAQRGQPSEHAAAVAMLDGTELAEVRGGLEVLGLAGDPASVEPISARIRRGLPPDLLEIAVDTLMILGRPEAGPVLIDLVSHRRASIRVRAVQAVIACRPRGAERVLVDALSDTDAGVRGAAAEGLGTLGATGAIDALFHAMERRVPEAPMAIAHVARAGDVARFLASVGRVPFDSVAPALSEMLHRTDLTERAKLDIIGNLSELATSGVRTFLEELVAGDPGDVGPRVIRAAREAIARIGQ